MKRFATCLFMGVAMFLVASMACADLIGTYVDAVSGEGGNTVNNATGSATDWVTTDNNDYDGLWVVRQDSAHVNGDFLEASDLSREGSLALMKTTITGLTPGQSYEVRVVYCGYQNDWTVDAGLSPTSLNQYVYGDGISEETGLNYSPNDNIQLQALLGTAVASAAGEIPVYVTELSTINGGRTRYDGVAYNAVPEPSCLMLIGSSLIGLLAYAWRKRK